MKIELGTTAPFRLFSSHSYSMGQRGAKGLYSIARTHLKVTMFYEISFDFLVYMKRARLTDVKYQRSYRLTSSLFYSKAFFPSLSQAVSLKVGNESLRQVATSLQHYPRKMYMTSSWALQTHKGSCGESPSHGSEACV